MKIKLDNFLVKLVAQDLEAFHDYEMFIRRYFELREIFRCRNIPHVLFWILNIRIT